MEKTDTLKRLEMPNANTKNEYVWYEKRMRPKLEFEADELKSFYLQHETEILALLEKEAWEYLVDFGAWDIVPGESFPCAAEMTGGWYVGQISFYEANKLIYGSIYMRFLGSCPNGYAGDGIDDYLGMDASFVYDKAQEVFIFDGFNTDAI